jgi:hypothetical protein
MIIDIDPTIIYFTHSRIRKSFTGCNKTLNDTLQEIINSKIKPSDLPIITVYYDGTNYFSQNNRRLWILKECIKLKLIDNIKVLIKKIGNKRYIASNCSLTAKQCMN